MLEAPDLIPERGRKCSCFKSTFYKKLRDFSNWRWNDMFIITVYSVESDGICDPWNSTVLNISCAYAVTEVFLSLIPSHAGRFLNTFSNWGSTNGTSSRDWSPKPARCHHLGNGPQIRCLHHLETGPPDPQGILIIFWMWLPSSGHGEDGRL